MRKFVLSNVSAVDTKETLSKHLKALSRSQLCKLACGLNLIPEAEGDQDKAHKKTYSKDFLLDLMVSSRNFCWNISSNPYAVTLLSSIA